MGKASIGNLQCSMANLALGYQNHALITGCLSAMSLAWPPFRATFMPSSVVLVSMPAATSVAIASELRRRSSACSSRRAAIHVPSCVCGRSRQRLTAPIHTALATVSGLRRRSSARSSRRAAIHVPRCTCGRSRQRLTVHMHTALAPVSGLRRRSSARSSRRAAIHVPSCTCGRSHQRLTVHMHLQWSLLWPRAPKERVLDQARCRPPYQLRAAGGVKQKECVQLHTCVQETHFLAQAQQIPSPAHPGAQPGSTMVHWQPHACCRPFARSYTVSIAFVPHKQVGNISYLL